MRVLKRLARWLVDLSAAGLAFATTLVGFVAWWLSGTAVTLDDVVTPYLERSMTAPYQMEIGSTAVRWGGFQQPLRLVAQNAVIRDGDGLPVVRVTEFEIGVDSQALLSGRIRPTDLTMVGARLYAARDAEGRVAAGFAAADREPAATDEAAPSGELLDALLAGLRGEPTEAVADLDSLARLEIADATVVVVDRGHQLVWTVPDVDAVLSRDTGGIRGSLDFSLPAAGDTATVSARFTYDAAAETVAIDASLNDFVPAGLADVDPVLAPLQALRAKIDGAMALSLGADLRPIDGRLSVDADALSLEIPELFDAPLALARLRLEAGIDFIGRQLAITEATVNLGGPRLSGSAVVAWTDEEIGADADLTLTDLPMALLRRYWPNPLNPSARAWIGGRMHEGTVLGASLGITTRSSTATPLDVEVTEVDVGLAYTDLSVLFMDGLPPVRAIDGIGHFDGEEFTLVVERGELFDLAIEQAVIRITDFDQIPETMNIEVTATGPLPSALAVIDRPRLGYAAALGLVPDQVGGTVSTDLSFTFPLAARLPFEDVDIQVSADIADAALGAVFDGMQVDAVTGALALDRSGFTFDGRARLNGVPLNAVWRQPFAAGGSRQVTMRGQLDRAALTALGLPVPDGFDGAAQVTARAQRGAGQSGTISIQADLTPVALAIPALDYAKAVGTPGSLAAEVIVGTDRTVTIDGIALDLPGLSAAGTVRLAADGNPVEIAFSRLDWGGNRLALSALPQGNGYAIGINAEYLDLSDLLSPEVEEGSAPDGDDDALATETPLWVDARARTVSLGDGRQLTDVNASLTLAQGDVRDLVVRAFVGESPISGEYRHTDNGESLVLQSDDAGRLLVSLGVSDGAEDGLLRLTARRDPAVGAATPWIGSLRIEGIRLIQAPMLARILAASSLTALQQSLATQGLTFDVVEAVFRLDDQSLVVEEGRAVGGALGLTLNGNLDRINEQVDLAGTLVPIFGVNQAIGSIPLIGDVLTGGDDQGVFALTYAVGGSLDAPDVSINPLSALAPGFLRRLFFEAPTGNEPVSILERRDDR